MSPLQRKGPGGGSRITDIRPRKKKDRWRRKHISPCTIIISYPCHTVSWNPAVFACIYATILNQVKSGVGGEWAEHFLNTAYHVILYIYVMDVYTYYTSYCTAVVSSVFVSLPLPSGRRTSRVWGARVWYTLYCCWIPHTKMYPVHSRGIICTLVTTIHDKIV